MSDPATFEMGDWTPKPISDGVTLPAEANVEREFQRLAAYLRYMNCQRSPFIWHQDCDTFSPDAFPVRDRCLRCRALARFGQQACA